jgi:chemotaxis protein histidine kinase CheA
VRSAARCRNGTDQHPPARPAAPPGHRDRGADHRPLPARGDAGDVTFDPLELDRFSTLQQLSRALAESATDLTSLQGSLDDLTRQYETLLLQQSRVSSDLQEGLMRTRMVPFEALVPRLRRMLRQAAADTGKQVQLRSTARRANWTATCSTA